MIDTQIRTLIEKPLQLLGKGAIASGLTANKLSFIGFGLGIMAGFAIMAGLFIAALVLILLSRLCDGLDGTVARLTKPTNKGAFLDIALDFLFYSFIPLSFAIYNPDWALASAFLIFTFIGTGSSFLAYAIMAEKAPIKNKDKNRKGFYYLGGLTEGTETILMLCACCLFPLYFPYFAYLFGCLCLVTTALRIHQGYIDFD